MMDYEDVITKVNKAVAKIDNQALKEIAFKTLLEDALRGGSNQGISTPMQIGAPILKTKPEGVTKKKSSSTDKPYSISAIRKEVKDAFEDADPNFEGVKPLKSLKTQWEKYLWVLEVARKKGVEMLTNGEVAYVLLEKFSLGVTERTVNNLTFKVEDGYVRKSDLEGVRAWRILDPGIELVSSGKTEDGGK